MDRITLPRQIGIVVRRARGLLGITQRELAQRAGVSERLVLALELGDAPGIRLDKLMAVLSAAGVDLFAEIGGNATALAFTAPASAAAPTAASAPQTTADEQPDHPRADAPLPCVSTDETYNARYRRLVKEALEQQGGQKWS